METKTIPKNWPKLQKLCKWFAYNESMGIEKIQTKTYIRLLILSQATLQKRMWEE